MKTTVKYTSLLLALVLMLSSCGAPAESEPPAVTESDTTEETEKETEPLIIEKYAERTVSMREGIEDYKALGRTYLSGDSLICDHAASGIELVLDCRGDVLVDVTANKADTLFTV